MRHRLALVVLGFGVVLAGCTIPSNAPLSYNDQVRSNFVNAGCMGGFPANGGTTTTLASSPVCSCSYEVFVANVPYNEDDRNKPPYQGYAGKNFEELNTELQRDASKYNDNTVLTQAVRDKINQCVQTNGASTPGTGPGSTGTAGSTPVSTPGTDSTGTAPR
jgi:hypothetical protein